jgi:nitroimidazol reductase NimA-like FMN-containing flavoprotein (pyridoxamine 5'-phosphate oxidase superfamily)
MFREMRRNDKQFTEEETRKILLEGEYGVLSTKESNGYAYGVPLNYAFSNDKIYFHCAQEGLKLDNIEYDNKVSFCVVGKVELLPEKFSTKYESAIVFGIASEVKGEEKQEALLAIIEKYSSEFMEEGRKYVMASGDKTKVYQIEIEHLTGKGRK